MANARRANQPLPKPKKKAAAKKAKEPNEKRLSAIDAAAQVLAKAKQARERDWEAKREK